MGIAIGHRGGVPLKPGHRNGIKSRVRSQGIPFYSPLPIYVPNKFLFASVIIRFSALPLLSQIPIPDGHVSANTLVRFSQSGSISSTFEPVFTPRIGSLSGSATIFTQAMGEISGEQRLMAEASIGFTASATSANNIVAGLFGAASLCFHENEGYVQDGVHVMPIAASANITFSSSLLARSHISASAQIIFSESAVVAGCGRLSGSAGITFASQAHVPTFISGTSDIQFAINAAILQGVVHISGVSEPEKETVVKYGLLYNCYAATDVRNIAAAGWHVPTTAEWNVLKTYLGGAAVAGGHLKESGYVYWLSPNTGADNSSNFNSRGSGYRSANGGFGIIHVNTYYWTSTPSYDSSMGTSQRLKYNDAVLSFQNISVKTGNSIRPIKDSTTLTHGQTGTYTGNDGKIYRTICIGTQEWLADNLCETQYRNHDAIPEVTVNSEWAALTTGGMCAHNNDWSYVSEERYVETVHGTLTAKGNKTGTANFALTPTGNLGIHKDYIAGSSSITFALAGVMDDYEPFMMTIDTTKAGSASDTFILPLGSAYPARNAFVDFGEGGGYERIEGSAATGFAHTYAVGGTYEVKVKGSSVRLYFNNTGDRLKVMSINKWGTPAKWYGQMSGAFYGCANLQGNWGEGVIDLTGVTTIGSLFRDCTSFNYPFIANAPSLLYADSAFYNAASLNSPITISAATGVLWYHNFIRGCVNFNSFVGIDTRSCTTLDGIFRDCSAFNNGSASGWNTSKVTSFQGTFQSALAFNQPLNGWNVGSATSMSSMFSAASSFNQSLVTWDVSKVANMQSMFSGASNFNGSLNGWNTQNATSMHSMFLNAVAFNQPVNHFAVSGVTSMASMFSGALVFNQDVNLWNPTKCTTLYSMFSNADAFNGLMFSNTPLVKNTSYMFRGASAFNQSLSGMDVSKVTNMSRMFQSASMFNGSLSGWQTNNLVTANSMFYGATRFNQPVSHLSVSGVSDFSQFFRGARYFNQDLSGWSTASATNMSAMFEVCSSFNGDVSSFDTSKVTMMNYMFSAATGFNQSLVTWDTGKVADFSYMFSGALSFKRSLGSFDIHSATSLLSMIGGDINDVGTTTNYDDTLNSWAAASGTPSGLTFSGGWSKYSAAASGAREYLDITKAWTISDGGAM